MKEMINANKIPVRKYNGNRQLERPRILKKQGGWMYAGFLWLRTGTSGRIS
jgi:hypothetical protein